MREPDPATALRLLQRDQRTAAIPMIVLLDAIDRAFVRRCREARLRLVWKASAGRSRQMFSGLFRFRIASSAGCSPTPFVH